MYESCELETTRGKINDEFSEIVKLYVLLKLSSSQVNAQDLKDTYVKRFPDGYFLECIDELIGDMLVSPFVYLKWYNWMSDKAQEICNKRKAVQISERVKSEKKDAPTMPPIYEMEQAPEQILEKSTSISPNHPAYAKLMVVFSEYPQFSKQFSLLRNIDDPYIVVTEEKITWLKTKQCLAEYFASLEKPKKGNHSWKAIEHLFDKDDLAHAYSDNGMSKKDSKDYRQLSQILKTHKL